VVVGDGEVAVGVCVGAGGGDVGGVEDVGVYELELWMGESVNQWCK
jgi:hypothetical protein